MSSVIQDIEASQLRGDIPDFAPGDRVRVHFLVIEGNRKRPQVFEGVVIRRQGSGARETFTVRKQSFGVGVERTFPVHSPKIEKLEVASRGAVRRAKLYYLRGRTGKAARVAERRWGIDEQVIGAGETGAVDASGEGLAPEEEEVVDGVAETEEPAADETAAPEASEPSESPDRETASAEDEATGADAGGDIPDEAPGDAGSDDSVEEEGSANEVLDEDAGGEPAEPGEEAAPNHEAGHDSSDGDNDSPGDRDEA